MSFLRDNRGKFCRFRPRGGWILWTLLVALLPGLTAQAVSRTATVSANAGNADPAMQYTRRIWRIQDGLPEDTVQAIQQSQDGYLWIGTTGGLLRFDGSHFHLYNHANVPALADSGSAPRAAAWCT
jgi:hypothetical protein